MLPPPAEPKSDKIYLFDTNQVLPPAEAPLVTGPYNHLRVFFQPADDAGCGCYRCIFPANALRKKGALVKWGYKVSPNDLLLYNIFIFQRPITENIATDIKQLKACGKTVIVELDDNLHNVPPSSPVYDMYKPNKLKWLTECIKTADGLIVSTPELAEYYYSYNKNISVCYNSIDLDEGYRDWSGKYTDITRKDPDDFVLGFRGGLCMSKDTEILTKDGFKFFKDLDKTELVAQLDPNTNLISYIAPTSYISEPYTGKLYTVNRLSPSFSTTDLHKVFCRVSGSTEYNFSRAQELLGTAFYLPHEGYYPGTAKLSLLLDEYYLLGTVFAQGKVFDIDKETGVKGIYFDTGLAPKEFNYLRGILRKLNYKLKVDGNKVLSFRYTGSGIEDLVTDMLYKGQPYVIPKYFTEFSGDQCHAFIRGLVGSLNSLREPEKGHTTSLYKSRAIPPDASEVVYQMGVHAGISINKKTTVRSVVLMITVGRETKVSSRDMTTTDVTDEMVYCVTVPTHLICVRRNGFTHWTGNSHLEDIRILSSTIKPLMNKYQNLNISLYSAIRFSETVAKTWGLSDMMDRVQFVQPRNFVLYPTGLAGPDAYVVPLNPNEALFNNCKSELALAEVGAFGIPAVSSNCAPYNRFSDNEQFGLSAHPKEFAEKISYLIENRDFTKQLGQKAKERTLSAYSLKNNVQLWLEGLEGIVEAKNRGDVGPGIVASSIQPIKGSNKKKSNRR